jgi:hypothetical protein
VRRDRVGVAGRAHMAVEDLPRLFGGGDKALHLRRADGVVEGIGRGNGADEDEHDEAHALLAVVGTVEEADAGAGEHHEGANGPRRRLLSFGRLIEGGVADETLWR